MVRHSILIYALFGIIVVPIISFVDSASSDEGSPDIVTEVASNPERTVVFERETGNKEPLLPEVDVSSSHSGGERSPGGESKRVRLDNIDSPPFRNDGGIYVYTYGEGIPTVECAPLTVCDIELEQGEEVKDLHLGDKVRWTAHPAMSGADGQEALHIIVKPKTADITTTMLVTTNRRTYYFVLKARADTFMPRVTFEYPDTMARAWQLATLEQKAASSKRKEVEKKRVYRSSRNNDRLDFSYSVEGVAEWKPRRVYNDGRHTYIDMPEDFEAMEAPILVVVGDNGDQRLTNYRLLDGHRYKVDGLFSQALMVTGVGDDQTRVAITREVREG